MKMQVLHTDSSAASIELSTQESQVTVDQEKVSDDPNIQLSEKVVREKIWLGLSPRFKVIIFIVLRCVTGAFYHAFAKSVMTEKKVFFLDLCLIRSVVNVSAASFNVKVFGKHIFNDVPEGSFKFIGFRSILGLFGFISIIFSLNYLPLTIVSIVFNTTTFWTGILAYCILKDKVTKREIIFMFGVFVGVVLISLAKHVEVPNDSHSNKISSGKFTIGVLAVLYTAWSFGGISILTHKLKDVHFSLIMFHYGWFATTSIFGFLIIEFLVTKSENYFYINDCKNIRLLCYTPNQWFYIFIPAIFNAFSMNFETIAFQLEKSVFVSILI